jgi:hypothetical protein
LTATLVTLADFEVKHGAADAEKLKATMVAGAREGEGVK